MTDMDYIFEYLPGGVIMIITNKYVIMIVSNRNNKQGRWVWVLIDGGHRKKITVITFYRPYDNTSEAKGLIVL